MDYQGALLFAPSVPVATTSSYLGMSNEGQVHYRLPSERGYWLDLLGSVGLDLWQRKLGTSQQEDYRIGVRLGVELGPVSQTGVVGGFGIKYPFWTYEDANLLDEGYDDQNPTLEPKGDLSLYGQIGYRFRRNLAVVGYVDGFRFKQSDPVIVTQGGVPFEVWQPQSTMYNIGVKLQYLF